MKVTEQAGVVIGVLAAPVFALTSALRDARTFHPRGDCADAEVTMSDGVPAELSKLAASLCGMAFVRFSDALTKKKARWPDVLGCAIRFGDYVDDPAAHGDQDLLLATIKRPWTMPFSPLSTHVHDYLANDYFAVSPFSIRGLDASVYFRLHPKRHVTQTSGIDATESNPERRRHRLADAIAESASCLVLGVGRGPRGPFAPLVDIELVRMRDGDPVGLRFDPFRNGRGIDPHGFVHGLRRGVYAASQTARS